MTGHLTIHAITPEPPPEHPPPPEVPWEEPPVSPEEPGDPTPPFEEPPAPEPMPPMVGAGSWGDHHRGMRTLVIVLALLAIPASSARAEGIGLGFFLGDPTGLDLKIDLQRRSALDVVLGLFTFRDRGPSYGHLTYLVTPVMGQGQSVRIPLRLGIGGAVYGNSNDVNLGVRVPLEVGLWFRRTPLEIYGEIALLLTVLDSNSNYDRLRLQGGIGLRFYF